MVAAHKARQIEGLAGGCARSMMAAKLYCAAVLFLYLPFTMPYITHGFLRADSRNSMGFILLYGKKNVSRCGFRHSVLEATRRPVCHVILQRCAGRDMLDDAAAEVRTLRRKGLRVSAVFMGEDRSAADAARIYGKNMARIRGMDQLARAAGQLIQNEIRELGD